MSDTSEDRQPAPSPQPVRVAWIAGPETFDRYARVLQPLAIGLMDELIEAAIFAPTGPDGRAEAYLPFPVLNYRLPRWWHLRSGPLESLALELRRRKVDLVHGLDGSTARLARGLARAAGAEYLLSSYCLDDARELGESGRDAAAILAASGPIRKALLDRRLAEPDRVHLMRPGVYHVRRPTCFNEPDHSVAIVAGGPLTDPSAFEAVLSCFAELTARRLDCVFFIIGSGPAERHLRHRAERLGLRGCLTFVDRPPVGELTGIFKAADVFIAPTRQRRIDMQSLLAMAAGVPVLAAAGQGADDFVLDGRTALTFAEGNAAELTVKLTALLDDYASARALAESAIAYIRENHSPAFSVGTLARICRGIVHAAAVKV